MSDDNAELNSIELATELTVAWLSNPNTRTAVDAVPAFLTKMRDAVRDLTRKPEPATDSAPVEHAPAVSVRKSLASSDYIISMIDGKPYKALRRHLTSNGLTPDEYRTRYGLKSDYPMVARSYSAWRSEIAKNLGLGRKPGRGGGRRTDKISAGE